MLAHKVAQYYQLKTASIDYQGKGTVVMATFVEGASRASLQVRAWLADCIAGTAVMRA